jgi:hypothetical protein
LIGGSATLEERMWVLVGIVVVLVAVGVGLAAAVVARRRSETAPLGAEVTADQWITLGIVFSGAGAALTATIGVWMIGMVVLGIVYMGIGMWMKRNHRPGQTGTRRP